jgi:hypothetical protein
VASTSSVSRLAARPFRRRWPPSAVGPRASGEIGPVREELLPERIDILLEWHRRRPPSEYERHRNAAIFHRQGNRNPLIDFPDRAERIAFHSGLGR